MQFDILKFISIISILIMFIGMLILWIVLRDFRRLK